MEHKKTNFRFWEQGNDPIYFRGTREHVPPWEGLNTVYQSVKQFGSRPGRSCVCKGYQQTT